MKVEANNPCCICGMNQSVLVFEKAYPEHGYPGLLTIVNRANEFRILYQKTRQIFRSMENTQKCLTDAVNALAQTPSYDDVEDSKGELADRCQGDNMVITARKIQK